METKIDSLLAQQEENRNIVNLLFQGDVKDKEWSVVSWIDRETGLETYELLPREKVNTDVKLYCKNRNKRGIFHNKRGFLCRQIETKIETIFITHVSATSIRIFCGLKSGPFLYHFFPRLFRTFPRLFRLLQ